MRILLVAYDFPPVRTPRALRWRYLVRELVLQGHDVHVLVPDLGTLDVAFPDGPGHLQIHSTWPGPFGWLVRRSQRRHADGAESPGQGSNGATPGRAELNWRGRLVDAAKRLCSRILFPDVRAEWAPWARRALRRILKQSPPDVVVTSHEPATTLPLGRMAQRLGFVWVADLGDPVCAPYTPRHWRGRSLRLEAMVSRHANAVVVTTEATRRLLMERHRQAPERCVVLPNGYDDRHQSTVSGTSHVTFDDHRLELIHAGRLYSYRDPTRLLEAVARTDGVRLTLIVPDPPEGRLAECIKAAGERVRMLGTMPHASVMDALATADVLVNIGNAGVSPQVPAKLYEYLGMERPILHVQSSAQDVVVSLLQPLDRGWIRPDDSAELERLLGELRQRKADGTLHEGLHLTPVPAHAHSILGRRLADMLEALAKPDGM